MQYSKCVSQAAAAALQHSIQFGERRLDSSSNIVGQVSSSKPTLQLRTVPNPGVCWKASDTTCMDSLLVAQGVTHSVAVVEANSAWINLTLTLSAKSPGFCRRDLHGLDPLGVPGFIIQAIVRARRVMTSIIHIAIIIISIVVIIAIRYRLIARWRIIVSSFEVGI